MPPKSAKATTYVYIVLSNTSVDSVYATLEAANARSADLKANGEKAKVEVQELVGGSVTPTAAAEKATQPKLEPKKEKGIKKEQSVSPQKKKIPAAKKEEEEDQGGEEEQPPPKKSKTKTPAEQRAANASKPNAPSDASLPPNVRSLLSAMGNALDGMMIVVTGVPPTLGRKNAEKLVMNYGGKLTKSLSKNTSLVVVGNDAGPTKLEKIEELGLRTVDEDGFVDLLEAGGGAGKKRKR
jgi:NAD-dependent DNA ligase